MREIVKRVRGRVWSLFVICWKFVFVLFVVVFIYWDKYLLSIECMLDVLGSGDVVVGSR